MGALPQCVSLQRLWRSAGNWAFGPNETQSGFAPLRIYTDGGIYYYGWVEVTVVSGNTYSPPYAGTVEVTVTGFAFENQMNTPIEAGAIPEPSTYALLALAGLFGAAVWHHRRQKVGAPTALLQLAAGARGVENSAPTKRPEIPAQFPPTPAPQGAGVLLPQGRDERPARRLLPTPPPQNARMRAPGVDPEPDS